MSVQERPDRDTLASVVARLAALIGSEGLPTGERAALRRMVPGHPPPLAFHRVAIRMLPDGWERQEDDWVAILAGIALMSPGAHHPGAGLGAALASAGFSETRLERLLSAQGQVRRLLLLRAARFLVAKSHPCDWAEGAALLLARDPDRREALHRRIARDFYRTQDARRSA